MAGLDQTCYFVTVCKQIIFKSDSSVSASNWIEQGHLLTLLFLWLKAPMYIFITSLSSLLPCAISTQRQAPLISTMPLRRMCVTSAYCSLLPSNRSKTRLMPSVTFKAADPSYGGPSQHRARDGGQSGLDAGQSQGKQPVTCI